MEDPRPAEEPNRVIEPTMSLRGVGLGVRLRQVLVVDRRSRVCLLKRRLRHAVRS